MDIILIVYLDEIGSFLCGFLDEIVVNWFLGIPLSFHRAGIAELYSTLKVSPFAQEQSIFGQRNNTPRSKKKKKKDLPELYISYLRILQKELLRIIS
jgi:hypothetical protein